MKKDIGRIYPQNLPHRHATDDGSFNSQEPPLNPLLYRIIEKKKCKLILFNTHIYIIYGLYLTCPTR